ncbi:hypothetical protein [Alteromonas sp. AMM-1]|uniref:hypothetical protein n=1 Tax=Alteromonas sp. AMM-1 TaxID=3394233 RepID=UPI0039A654E5
MTTTLFVSVALSALACYAIYIGWATQKKRWAYAGWAGIAVSIVAWCNALGTEFGITVGLCLPAIMVWLGIGRHAKAEKTKPDADKPPHQWQWQGKAIALTSWHILYVLIVQMVTFSLIVVALVYQLPISEPKQMATGVIILPLVWGVLAYWYVMSEHKLRHILFSVVLAAVAALYLFGVAHG